MHPMLLLCANTATESFLKNPIETGKTNYLDVHWHYCRELFADGKMMVSTARTSSLADMSTRKHSGPKFTSCKEIDVSPVI
jgi:hypothetical protein